MNVHRLSTSVIVAADLRVSRVLNGPYATTSFTRLFREIDSHLRFTMQDVDLTETTLAVGWLIEEGRIELECIGTNAWAHYRGVEPLVFQDSFLRLSFKDIPTFTALQKAEMEVREANRQLAIAQQKVSAAQQELWAAHDQIRLAAAGRKVVAEATEIAATEAAIKTPASPPIPVLH